MDLKNLHAFFQNKGSKLLCIVDGDQELPITKVPSCNVKVRWVCANNSSHIQTTILRTLTKKKDAKLVCRSCSHSGGKNGRTTYSEFVNLLEDHGWEMLSPISAYTNNKSVLKVKCNNGHETETFHGRFSAGFRCKFCMADNKRVRDAVQVAEEFKEKGFTLLESVYKNNATNMRYICKCGREGMMTYTNFTRNISGCKDCTRRWTYDATEDFFEEMGCSLLSSNDNKPEFMINASSVTYICFCGTKHTSTLKSFKRGARCPECTKRSIRESCLITYGVDNPSKCKEVTDRGCARMLRDYGKAYAMQIEEFRDKCIATNIRNHGGKHNLTDPDVRQKANDAFQTKYGASFGNVPEIQQKTKDTNMERLGVEYPFQSSIIQKKIKATILDRYGVEHISHVPEIVQKATRSRYSSKGYTTPSGNIWSIQGYEYVALDSLFDHGYKEDDIIIGPANVPHIPYHFQNKDRLYYPDIYIKSKDLLIEVKSTYIFELEKEQNLAKFWGACKYHNFELWICDKKSIIQVKPFINSICIFSDDSSEECPIEFVD